MLQKRIDEMTAFNDQHFEKKLLALKESQESIQSLSTWCLQHRTHHKKIVSIWLKVLKKVNLAHRLALFYLANDVIQYSKRKNYEFVESWGTSLQKATTLVREEKVKDKILRIFKIWGDRGVYDDTFITDLSGLMSTPAKKKPVAEPEPDPGPDPLDFLPSVLFNKIRSCHKLEDDTDLRLKRLNESGLSLSDADALRSQFKDRSRGDDLVAEVDEGVKKMDAYMKALEMEIVERRRLIEELDLAEKYYEAQKGDAKLVVNAYRNFGNRVKNLKRHLDERLPSFACPSPVPSPDINAPSPSPECDMELPEDDPVGAEDYSSYIPGLSDSDPMYAAQDQAFETCFASFLGNGLPFDFQKNLFSEPSAGPNESEGKPIEVINSRTETEMESSISNFLKSLGSLTSGNSPLALNPSPAPDLYAPLPAPDLYAPLPAPDLVQDDYEYTPEDIPMQPPPPPPSLFMGLPPKFPTWKGAVEGWEEEVDLETPESPPPCEKEGFSDPVEYDDSASLQTLGSQADVDHRPLGRDMDHRPPGRDVDQRLLRLPPPPPPKAADVDHRVHAPRNKDVDHRNLISLTGSPGQEVIPAPPAPPPAMLWPVRDQDYRSGSRSDRTDVDYRFPPPPPPVVDGSRDNVESVDMELSDDESAEQGREESPPKKSADQPPVTFNISAPNKLAVSPLDEATDEEQVKKRRLFGFHNLPPPFRAGPPPLLNTPPGHPPNTPSRHPLNTSPRPVLNSPQPVLNSTRPVVNSLRPVLNSSQPMLNSPRPMLNSSRPVLNSSRPMLNSPRPMMNSSRPVLNSSRPMLNSPRPMLNSSRPVLNSPQPMLNPSRPVLNSPHPMLNSSRPMLNSPRPVLNSTEPLLNSPRPLLSTPLLPLSASPPMMKPANERVDAMGNDCDRFPGELAGEFDSNKFGFGQDERDMSDPRTGNGPADPARYDEGAPWPRDPCLNGREAHNPPLSGNILNIPRNNPFVQPLPPKEMLMSREPPFREPSPHKPPDYADDNLEHWQDDHQPKFSQFNEWDGKQQDPRPFGHFPHPPRPRGGFNPRARGGPRGGGDQPRRAFGGRGGARGAFRSPFMGHQGQYGGW